MPNKIPTAPARTFFNDDLDRSFMHELILELQERHAGTFVMYYAVSSKTVYDELYGETIGGNVFCNPIKLFCVVDYQGQTQTTSGSMLQRLKKVDISVYKKHVEQDQHFKVKSGDLFLIGETFYEVTAISDGEPVFGNLSDMVHTKCEAIQAMSYHINAMPKVIND